MNGFVHSPRGSITHSEVKTANEPSSRRVHPKSRIRVVPASPLPHAVPFSGEQPTDSASASAASTEAGEGKLRIDLAGSSVTVFVMSKG